MSPGGEAQWTKYRDRIDPTRLVFIDETPGPKPIWRRCGAGRRRGQRIKAKVPHGSLADHDLHGRLAPRSHHRSVVHRGGRSTAEAFLLYIEKVPDFLTLRHGDIVIMDNLGSHKANAVRRAIRTAGARLFYPAEILARPEPDRAVLRQSSNTGYAKPHSAPPRPSTTLSRRSSIRSHRPNAPITSPTPDMTKT